jgi:hypothetical protein
MLDVFQWEFVNHGTTRHRPILQLPISAPADVYRYHGEPISAEHSGKMRSSPLGRGKAMTASKLMTGLTLPRTSVVALSANSST